MFPQQHFGTLMGRIIPKLQAPFDLPDSVAPVKKIVQKLSLLSGSSCADAFETNSIVNDSIVKWL